LPIVENSRQAKDDVKKSLTSINTVTTVKLNPRLKLSSIRVGNRSLVPTLVSNKEELHQIASQSTFISPGAQYVSNARKMGNLSISKLSPLANLKQLPLSSLVPLAELKSPRLAEVKSPRFGLKM